MSLPLILHVGSKHFQQCIWVQCLIWNIDHRIWSEKESHRWDQIKNKRSVGLMKKIITSSPVWAMHQVKILSTVIWCIISWERIKLSERLFGGFIRRLPLYMLLTVADAKIHCTFTMKIEFLFIFIITFSSFTFCQTCFNTQLTWCEWWIKYDKIWRRLGFFLSEYHRYYVYVHILKF